MTTKTLRPPYKRLSIFNLWASGGGAAEGQTLLTGNQSGRPTSFKPYRTRHAVSFGAAFSFGMGQLWPKKISPAIYPIVNKRTGFTNG